MREVELKLAVDPSFVVPDVGSPEARITRMEELPTQNLRAVYFDTKDLNLARHGITLRQRTGDDGPAWTLKLPVDSGAEAVRDEFHFEAESDVPPPEASSLVRAYVRRAELEPVAHLLTRRRRWSLYGHGQDELAELVDDEVTVVDSGEVVARFRELEIEARSCERGDLADLSQRLREAGAVIAEPIPKAVRALGARATAPPDLPLPPELSPDDPAGAAVRAALLRGVRRIVSNDPGVRLAQVEAVHAMRVGARRLRSDLRTFRPLVHEYWADALVSELKWIADRLGAVRDIDVFKENLNRMAPDLEDDLKPLMVTLDNQHDDARASLLEALSSDRYLDLLDTLTDVAREPHLTHEAVRSCGEALPPLVAATWSKLARGAQDLKEASPAEDFHQVRIKAKRARYAVEAVAPALGAQEGEAKRFASKVEAVQENLGNHQDALVAADTIEKLLGSHDGDGRLHLAAGRLIERHLFRAQESREEFFKVWEKLDSKKRRKWFQT